MNETASCMQKAGTLNFSQTTTFEITEIQETLTTWIVSTCPCEFVHRSPQLSASSMTISQGPHSLDSSLLALYICELNLDTPTLYPANHQGSIPGEH